MEKKADKEVTNHWICDTCTEMGEDANEKSCDRPEHCWATIQGKIIAADRLKDEFKYKT